LTKDNAKLLQRWLDAKQAEANKMNEANEFYENMRSQHQAVLSWRDQTGSDVVNPVNIDAASQDSASRNGDMSVDSPSARENGTPPPPAKDMDLTPNG
jgi:autophagy-related protein 16